MLTDKSSRVDNPSVDARDWFSGLISSIKIDDIMHETDTMDISKRQMYNAMISGDHDNVHSYARQSTTKYFIKNLVDRYFVELSNRKRTPKRLALDLSDSKILVWAEIENDDEETENALILSAAKVNSQFSQHGFHLSSTIVEVEDNLNVPAHYQEVTIS